MCWAQIAGAGIQAGTGAMQGAQTAEQLNYNASIMDMKAEDAAQRGGVAEDQMRLRGRQQVGQQTAAIGTSGLKANTGTLGQLQVDTAGINELDAQSIRANAMREVWGYRTEAENMRAQAVQAGVMQRMLMPGMEGGFKEGLAQQMQGGNPLKFGKQMDYIKTGKFNSGSSFSEGTQFWNAASGTYQPTKGKF